MGVRRYAVVCMAMMAMQWQALHSGLRSRQGYARQFGYAAVCMAMMGMRVLLEGKGFSIENREGLGSTGRLRKLERIGGRVTSPPYPYLTPSLYPSSTFVTDPCSRSLSLSL